MGERVPNSIWHHKKKLISAPALVLPNPQKPFKFYAHEKQGVGLEVLIQMGDSPQHAAYFSEKARPHYQRLASHLRARAATCDVLQEAEKFTLGQSVCVCITSSFNLARTKGCLLVNSWVNGQMSSPFARQPTCYLTNYNYLKPSYPTSESGDRLRPQKLLARCTPANQTYSTAAGRLWLRVVYWQKQLHGKWTKKSRVCRCYHHKVIEAHVPSAGTSARKAE